MFYKQRFYPLVKFLKKISNTTSLFQITKQHYQKIKQQKLVNLNFCLSNSQSYSFTMYHKHQIPFESKSIEEKLANKCLKVSNPNWC